MSDVILVTGAGGYLGHLVVAQLRRQGMEAIGVYRRPLPFDPPARAAICNLADGDAVSSLIAGTRPKAIIHAAAWIGSSASDPGTLVRGIEDNVVSTAHLACAAAKAGVQRFVLCSSVEVYAASPQDGRAHREVDPVFPQGLYGRTKAAAEEVVRSLAGCETVPHVIRMPGLHGSGRQSGIVHKVVSAVKRAAPVDIDEPETVISILWAEDAARVLTAASLGALPSHSEVRNLESGSASLSALAQLASKLGGHDLDIRLGRRPARNRALDGGLIRAELPFDLLSIEEGLRRELHGHA